MSGIELGVAATALLAASTVTAAVGAVVQGNNANKAAKYNANLAERDARIARQQGAAEELRLRREQLRRRGATRSALGPINGNALDLLVDEQQNMELDVLNLRYNTELRASGYQQTAAADRLSGRSQRSAGYVRGASLLAQGGAQVAGGF